ncbi:3-keto-5-aminohexanoate cleavage protein [Pigmentiphaga sp.]|uniref:3-keto-5-aminohexanoate cleavage protein n=1 Tax=Pigmentiphaga sp. TaxID=1977564 RepID=UPI0012C6A865|nr:3-keto-5-aminohexanoate cleavage protein [Pigmentiphaga sp.]MPS28896.1 3-keto-5-aminohexanoate cleavage protein [Alcaligenaceae bacterium SAGV5]MPS52650.1 3-keto-5-aminohexanoate cleavage protein [Alcaligenaceae bacterium SAGV3]MPT60447.1 3-keto-5-aminohexanoate cleavage protein [Alcaligenaceae bacterium]
MPRKVIITCAVTGSVHTPSMSPHLPITPDQIAEQAVDAARAGAAILHLHARHAADGKPAFEPEVYRQFLPRIHAQTDAVINITTGGSHTMTLEQRLAGAIDASAEMASCNMGSMNFALFPVLDKMKDFDFPWEREHLEKTRNAIFRNTFGDIETIFERLGGAHGTRFEFECYDVGHLYNLKHFVDRGLVQGPIFLQFVLGVLGGIGADPENLVHMKRIADKLFGDGYQWSVLAAGRHQMPLVTQAALMGGNVRVGLEDSLSIGPGEMATSNAQQVGKIRGILESFGFGIATPDEAREMLGLKGREKVALAA